MRRLVLAVALAACGKGGGATGSAARDAMIDAWKKGGLEVSAFAPATNAVGKDCATGTVNKLEVLLCTFASADDAKKAADLGLQWVGDTTGVSQARGAAVIAIADRHKADPHGKTIAQILKLAPN
jgi:hypothetical protein